MDRAWFPRPRVRRSRSLPIGAPRRQWNGDRAAVRARAGRGQPCLVAEVFQATRRHSTMNGCCNLSRLGFGPSPRATPGSTADGGWRAARAMTITVRNADKRIGANVFRRWSAHRLGSPSELRPLILQQRTSKAHIRGYGTWALVMNVN